MATKNDKKLQETEKVAKTTAKATTKKVSDAKVESTIKVKATKEKEVAAKEKEVAAKAKHTENPECIDDHPDHVHGEHCNHHHDKHAVDTKKVTKTTTKTSAAISTHALLHKITECYFDDHGKIIAKPEHATVADIKAELQSVTGLSYTYAIVLAKGFISRAINQYITQRYSQEKPHINGFAPGRASIIAVKQYYANLFARHNGHFKTVAEYVIVQQLQNVLGILSRHYQVTFISEPKYLNLSKLTEDHDIECVFKIDIEPSIPEVDLASIKIEHSAIKVEESDIDKALKEWCERNYKPVPLAIIRAAQMGDIVTLDLVMKGTSDAMNDITLMVGSGKLAKELEDSIVGKNVGETYTQVLKISEDFPDKNVAGSVIQAIITIKNIQGAELYKQDADMFKAFDVNTLEECREKMAHHIKLEGEKLAELVGRHHMLQKLSDQLDIQLPEATLDSIIYQYVEFLANHLRIQLEYPVTIGQKAQIDPIMEKELGCTYDQWMDKVYPMIISEAKQRLFLAKYGRENKINVLQTELDHAIAMQAANFPGGLENAIEFYTKETNARNRLINQLYHEKLLKDIYSKVTKKEHELTMTEMIKTFEKMTDKMQKLLQV